MLTALDHALRSRDVRAGQLIHHRTRAPSTPRCASPSASSTPASRPRPAATGDSYDNALAENLWSTIKIELVYWPETTFATRTEAEHDLVRYIDGWYNPRRIQTGLGGPEPGCPRRGAGCHLRPTARRLP